MPQTQVLDSTINYPGASERGSVVPRPPTRDFLLFECPRCGGTLDMDEENLVYRCDHCGKAYEIDEVTEGF